MRIIVDNNQNHRNNGNQDPNKKENRRNVIICLVIALGVFLVFSFMNRQVEKASKKEITYDQLYQDIVGGRIEKIELPKITFDYRLRIMLIYI